MIIAGGQAKLSNKNLNIFFADFGLTIQRTGVRIRETQVLLCGRHKKAAASSGV